MFYFFVRALRRTLEIKACQMSFNSFLPFPLFGFHLVHRSLFFSGALLPKLSGGRVTAHIQQRLQRATVTLAKQQQKYNDTKHFFYWKKKTLRFFIFLSKFFFLFFLGWVCASLVCLFLSFLFCWVPVAANQPARTYKGYWAGALENQNAKEHFF